jgi:gliding motility-associated-like protein
VYPGAETNSSPTFLVNDTAVICNGNFFQLSFQANEPDAGDSLSYSFCSAYTGASQGDPAPGTATAPPYTSIPYQAPYSGSQPLGPGVSINPVTGLISGTAPNGQGEYVICVCVNEWRDGVLISTTRKELHVRVNDCDPLEARLDPRNATCDGFDVFFQNDFAGNPPGAEYLWIFGDPLSGIRDTSYLPSDSHRYTDTGVYVVKLRVSLTGGLCADSATLLVRVFPGFVPNMEIIGSCYQGPFEFRDRTFTAYGILDSWRWNFGDLSTLADTSRLQNPFWTYPAPGSATAQLIVTNSKGCIDTVEAPVDIRDKPALSVPFADTLICRNDVLQLHAIGSGDFLWTSVPAGPLTNPTSPDPTVAPPVTTWYYVELDDDGCVNRDSIRVRVVNSVTLQAGADSTICLTDPAQLYAVSDGLSYTWTASPSATFSDPNSQNPTAIGNNALTRYTVVARIGSCSATDFMDIRAIPYPGSDAGLDPRICYNTSGQITASIVGSSFHWSPTSYLNDSTILNPIATPPRTTQYVLSVYDVLGCPKPGRDTVVVIVQPKIIANAGRDTTVVVGQPLLFNGTGGVNYLWVPAFGLSNPNIRNPIGRYGTETDSVRYKMIAYDEIGCADSAYVTVYVYKTNPTVFVPTAFTPNNDGLNDVIRPIAVGIRRINYFAVYNRWGERVFYTTANKHGWDGMINGKKQGTGVYVWMVHAEDYLGKQVFLKGTVALIR